MKDHKFKEHLYSSYAIYAAIIIIIDLAWFYLCSKRKEDTTVFFTVIGGVFSFYYFVQKQKLEELQLFKVLFSEFNKRYDEMNEQLSAIVNAKSKDDLTADEKNILADYFNLCSEEYLYFRKGYIYSEVWEAWSNGMKYYLQHDPRINEYWNAEKASDSYYGFDIKT